MSKIIAPDNAKELAYPIHEYFDFVAPKTEDDPIYFKIKKGRYEDTVFHYVFGEDFEATGQYKVVLDLVPKRFGDKDILHEELMQRMVSGLITDIIKEAIDNARQPSDPDSDPPQSNQQ